MNGIVFKPAIIVVLDVKDDFPVFGEVVEVYVVGDNRIILYTRILETTYYNHHFHAYAVVRSPSYKLITPNDLYSPSVLQLHHLHVGQVVTSIVVLKYHIVNSV